VDEYELEILDAPQVAYKILSYFPWLILFIKWLAQGYIHSYIDFFHIVNNKMPILIEPGSRYQEHLENKDKNYI
jgi:hypothetical protein